MNLARAIIIAGAVYLAYRAFTAAQQGGGLLPPLLPAPAPNPAPVPSHYGADFGGSGMTGQGGIDPIGETADAGSGIELPGAAPVSAGGADPLTVFCTAIRDFEGKPGDRNYRNNNPGNVRYYAGGYASQYGRVTRDAAGYAVFPSWAAGWSYLLNEVKSKIVRNPSWTFLDFFRSYAPAADHNQPATYAAYVARRCGVSVAANCLAFINGMGAGA